VKILYQAQIKVIVEHRREKNTVEILLAVSSYSYLDKSQLKLKIDQTPCYLGLIQQNQPNRLKNKNNVGNLLFAYYQSRIYNDVKIEQLWHQVGKLN
jgi:hypothetical protein